MVIEVPMLTNERSHGVDGAPPRRETEVFSGAGDVAVGAPIEQAEALLPADLIHDDEIIILLLRPSPWYIVLGSIGSLIFIGLVTFALAWMAQLPWIHWSDGQAFLFGMILVAGRLVWQTLEWWCRIYVLTDRRIIRKMGVMRVAVFEAPLRRIQHTSVFESLRERVFRLGSIGFATAGSDTFEAFWVMIARPYAMHRIVVQTIERYSNGARGV